MKKIIERTIFIFLSILLEFIISYKLMMYFYNEYYIIKILVTILSFLIVSNILKNSKSLVNDLPWIILILLLPITGTFIYIIINHSVHKSKLLKTITRETKESQKYYQIDNQITKEIDDKGKDILKYLNNYWKFPVSKNNLVKLSLLVYT